MRLRVHPVALGLDELLDAQKQTPYSDALAVADDAVTVSDPDVPKAAPFVSIGDVKSVPENVPPIISTFPVAVLVTFTVQDPLPLLMPAHACCVRVAPAAGPCDAAVQTVLEQPAPEVELMAIVVGWAFTSTAIVIAWSAESEEPKVKEHDMVDAQPVCAKACTGVCAIAGGAKSRRANMSRFIICLHCNSRSTLPA